MKTSKTAFLFLMLASVGCSTTELRPIPETAGVYEVFLRDWYTREKQAINLSKVAYAPTDKMIGEYQDCLTSNQKDTPRWLRPATADLQSIMSPIKYVHFVDPSAWKLKDPQAAIDRGGSINSAVQTGFQNALMEVSAVSFNPARDLAAVTFSFRCGQTCGNGGVALYAKSANGWVRTEEMCEWMSQALPNNSFKPNALRASA